MATGSEHCGDSCASYGAELGPKLCLLLRDHGRVPLTPLRVAFGKLPQYDVREKSLGDGETDSDVMVFLEGHARDEGCLKYRCVVAVFAGFYGATGGGDGVCVSGRNLSLQRIAEPFNASRVWHGKAKVFILQHEPESQASEVCIDARPPPVVASFTNLPAYVDFAFALGYGGSAYLDHLCSLLGDARSRRLEFHQLMTLLAAKCRKPGSDSASAGYFSHLRKHLFLDSA